MTFLIAYPQTCATKNLCLLNFQPAPILFVEKAMTEPYAETVQSPAVEYFFNGVLTLKLDGVFGDLVRQSAKDMFEKHLAEGERLEEKYAGSIDLRPNDSARFKAIEESFAAWDGKKHIEQILRRPVSLNILQIRRAIAGQSYMSTHRDTYLDGAKIVGNVPAIPKLIYYHAETDESQLDFYVGSHQRFFKSKRLDRIFHQLFTKKIGLKARPDSIVLFDTFSVHSVPNLKHDAVRIILSLKYETGL